MCCSFSSGIDDFLWEPLDAVGDFDLLTIPMESTSCFDRSCSLLTLLLCFGSVPGNDPGSDPVPVPIPGFWRLFILLPKFISPTGVRLFVFKSCFGA